MTPFQKENFSDTVTMPAIFDHTVLCGYSYVIFLFFYFSPFGHKLVWSTLFKHSSLLVLAWSIVTFKYLFLYLLGFHISRHLQNGFSGRRRTLVITFYFLH